MDVWYAYVPLLAVNVDYTLMCKADADDNVCIYSMHDAGTTLPVNCGSHRGKGRASFARRSGIDTLLLCDLLNHAIIEVDVVTGLPLRHVSWMVGSPVSRCLFGHL